MFKFEDILLGDFSNYPEDVQEYMKKYTEKLREAIKAELTKDLADKMLKDVNKNNETFVNILTEILENGCKGFNNMSTKALLDIYLQKKNEEDFIELIDKIKVE
jgi:polyhydroxyalkanoate synthesis regulator protein